MDWILNQTVEQTPLGVSIGKESLTDLDYADDVGLLAEMLLLQDVAAPVGLQINWTKTRIQQVREPRITRSTVQVVAENRLGGRDHLPRVADFAWWRKWGQDIGITRECFCLLEKNIWRSTIYTNTNVHLYRTYIIQVLWDIDCHQDPGQTPWCLRHQAYYIWDSSEHHRLFASLRKTKMLSAEVLRSPGSVSPGGRLSPCRLRRIATAIWLEETRGASKNHLAENDRRWRSAQELWSPHGVEKGKGQGGLATSRQYGNALLGVGKN